MLHVPIQIHNLYALDIASIPSQYKVCLEELFWPSGVTLAAAVSTVSRKLHAVNARLREESIN